MGRMFKAVAGTVLAGTMMLGVGTASSMGGPLKAEVVAGNADWVVHVDFEAARQTVLGERVRERLNASTRATAGRAYVQKALGVDPMTDLLDVTLYGRGPEPGDAVMLATVAGSLDKLLEHERGRRGTSFQQESYGSHTIYSWLPKPGEGEAGRRHVNVQRTEAGHQRVLVSESVRTLELALDVLDGTALNAVEAGSTVVAIPADSDSSLYIAAENLATLVENKPRSAMFQNIRQMTVQSGQQADGQGFFTVQVTATDEAAAKNLHDAVQGLLAMARLRAASEDAGLKELVDAVQIAQEESLLAVDVRLSAETVVEVLERRVRRYRR